MLRVKLGRDKYQMYSIKGYLCYKTILCHKVALDV